MRFFLIIIYFVLFYLLIKFVRMLMRYFSSSKPTVNDLKNEKRVKHKYDDIEEAKFKEIKDESSNRKENEKE